jgi:hypothetical protein
MSTTSSVSFRWSSTGGRICGSDHSYCTPTISASSSSLINACPPYHNTNGQASYSALTFGWSTSPVQRTSSPMPSPAMTQRNRRWPMPCRHHHSSSSTSCVSSSWPTQQWSHYTRKYWRAPSSASRHHRRAGDHRLLGTELSLSSRGRMTLGVGAIFWFISHTLS